MSKKITKKDCDQQLDMLIANYMETYDPSVESLISELIEFIIDLKENCEE